MCNIGCASIHAFPSTWDRGRTQRLRSSTSGNPLLFGLVTAAIYVLLCYQLVGLFANKQEVINPVVYMTFYMAIYDWCTSISIYVSFKEKIYFIYYNMPCYS